ncbi:hypothetical protein ACF0H5_014874 [Mactra antiquata]
MNTSKNWVRSLIRSYTSLCTRRLTTSLSVTNCSQRKTRRTGQIPVRGSVFLPSSARNNLMDIKALRQDVKDIFDAAVTAVYPPEMIRNTVTLSDDDSTLIIDGHKYKIDNNVYVVGFGKAVSGMARTVEDILGDHLVKGIISIPHGSQELFKSIHKDSLCVSENSKITVYEGARDNMPDDNANKAAMAILDLIQSLNDNHLLIVLISGGGSALLPSPIPPITLSDELEMTKVVSTHGGSIHDLNVLRQNIEILKGGGLAAKAKPAKVVSLILSDVIEDKLDIISSGPTSPMHSSPRQCLQILDRLQVKDKVPPVIIETLEGKASKIKTSREIDPQHLNISSFESQWDHVKNIVIGSNCIATQAAYLKANTLGYVPLVLTNTLQGEAKKAAKMFAELALYVIYCFETLRPDEGNATLTAAEIQLIELGINKIELKRIEAATTQAQNSKSGVCIICGGETIVNVSGNGVGGRNQEMALAFAMEYKKLTSNENSKYFDKFHVEFLSAGTDGQDGPTDAAGAVVNRYLIPAALSSKVDPSEYLLNNDSNTFFKLVTTDNCLIQTGLTGTNVMDIQTLIVKP